MLLHLYSFHPIGVPRIVSDVVKGFRQPLSERNLVLKIDIPENLPVVRADRAAMMLALSNLVDMRSNILMTTDWFR